MKNISDTRGKRRILYIGETKTHSQYQKGNVPSHWFYGAVEMEKDGHEVIWCQERRSLLNDLKLIRSNKHDLIFIPNLNLKCHFFLLFLAAFKIYRKPIYTYIHRAPKVKAGLTGYLYRLLHRGLRHVFFLSEKSMQECINDRLLKKEFCSVSGWGPDMKFYSNIETSDNGCFVSTGKENRDFDTLVEAFRITGVPLRIYTVSDNYTSHYGYLVDKCKDIPNIEVTILENSAENYPMMLQEMAAAHALVCPLRQDKLHYCVGLSTIADAEGLKKPLIITKNPYHDNRPTEDDFMQVETVEDWMNAINNCQKTKESKFTMAKAWANMKSVMNL